MTDEQDLIGEPLEEVPQRDPGEDCNARKSSGGTFRGYCGATAGKGTDHVGEGRCSHHGGSSDGAPEDNTNAVTHGAYADCNSYY